MGANEKLQAAMRGYTPNVGLLKVAYAELAERSAGKTWATSSNEFDRALAGIRAEAKAEALEEAADAMDADVTFRDPLRLKSDWLRIRAEQFREATN